MTTAIISTYDKTGIVPFMERLHGNDWDLFATSGTQKAFNEATGIAIASLADLVEVVTGKRREDRTIVAQQVGLMMLTRQNVGLACVNLRPPDPVNRLDAGGIGMIESAMRSGAMVATDPKTYDAILSSIETGEGPSQSLVSGLQRMAHDHIYDHINDASVRGIC
jgi:AICAR transformylase/IMP cyclohydrolase PurH